MDPILVILPATTTWTPWIQILQLQVLRTVAAKGVFEHVAAGEPLAAHHRLHRAGHIVLATTPYPLSDYRPGICARTHSLDRQLRALSAIGFVLLVLDEAIGLDQAAHPVGESMKRLLAGPDSSNDRIAKLRELEIAAVRELFLGQAAGAAVLWLFAAWAFATAELARLGRRSPTRTGRTPRLPPPSTSARLLTAVLSAPDEDAPRQAFATWLATDGGDSERAEFIQLQLAEADQSGEPGAADRERSARIDELLDDHEVRWAGKFHTWAHRYHFVRGFIEWIEIDARDWARIGQQAQRLAPVRHLTLFEAAEAWNELLAGSHLRGIQSLAMPRSGLTDAHAQQLAADSNLDSIRWLELGGNAIGRDGVFGLVRAFPDLDYLGLEGNPFAACQRFEDHEGQIIDSWLTEPALELQREFGELRWLNRAPTTIRDTIPPRITNPEPT